MKRHQIATAVRQAGHAIEDEALDTRLAHLVEDRLLLEHDDFFLFLACEIPEGPMRSSEIVQQVLAEAGDGVRPMTVAAE
jgi:hypothetical protein